jgi:hypothetical protein
MSQGPLVLAPPELPLEPELLLEPELPPEPELLLEPALPLEPELPLEPALPLEPEPLLDWTTIVPVVVGLVVCGVMVNVFPETQYEYGVVLIVIALPEVVKLPLVDGAPDTTPIPPAWWTVAEHVHPPLAAGVQTSDA